MAYKPELSTDESESQPKGKENFKMSHSLIGRKSINLNRRTVTLEFSKLDPRSLS